ncbi:MAG: molybdopterin-synthase adenylyltransferase MoeB [Flavobacteriaceae bacterium]|nr:molybdopterin-synthase adenylyltransferase MoeB [Flavobacteriaceae bacterium]
MKLSQEEYKQYDRHLILEGVGEAGQLKLKQAKVLVIGAGGLGCPILQYLTAAGVGTIGVVDHDVVDQSNLQRQVLYGINDIGVYKVDAAISRLAKLNPFVQFVGYKERLDKNNALDIMKQYDIVVDGSDNFPTRYLVNDTSLIAGKPLVFGSIFKFEGQVSVFNYKNGPSYRCLFPNPPKDNQVPNCSEIGVLGVLPGIIGSFQANETLKIILEQEEVLSGKLLMLDALSMAIHKFNINKTEALAINTLLDDYDFFCGISQVNTITYNELREHEDLYELLDVRTSEERATFHIGGYHIPLHELETRFQEIETNKPIVVYCKSGMRSKKAIDLLSEKLNNNLIQLDKGIADQIS